MKKLYPSDVTDFEWEIVKELISESKKGGGKRRVDPDLIVVDGGYAGKLIAWTKEVLDYDLEVVKRSDLN